MIDAGIRFGDLRVFSHLDATFRSGEVTALAGPSGSGKSSLLAAVAGFRPLSEGRIEIHGLETHHTAPRATLSAWVPQGSNSLARRTVLDNVLIASLAAGRPMSEAREESMHALAQVGMDARALAQARRLSGGELQRVALARALASGKPLILADEPSANLDEANTLLVAELLARLVTRATVIVATHDPTLIEAAHATVQVRRVRAAGDAL